MKILGEEYPDNLKEQPCRTMAKKSLSKLLYSDETSLQKLRRIGKKLVCISIAGISLGALGFPIYHYFNRQENLSTFLEDVVKKEESPIEKVCSIEEEFKNYSVLEYMSFFDYGRFLELHEQIFETFTSAISTIKDLKSQPEEVLKSYYAAMEKIGFEYAPESSLGQGFMQKKLNCAIRTLMFLSDVGYRMKLPVYGIVHKNHTLLKYDDGEKSFFFETINGKVLDEISCIKKGYHKRKLLRPDEFVYAILRNYTVTILRKVWKPCGGWGYCFSNYLNRENACHAVLAISSVAKKLNPDDSALYLSDAWAHLCLGDATSAEEDFKKAREKGVEIKDSAEFILTFEKVNNHTQ